MKLKWHLGEKNGSLHQKGHYRGIASSYIVSRRAQINGWKKKKKKVYVEQTKSTVIFTHSPNKCHNIFRKYLFLVVISHNFIFYYFMLTYKKLTDLEKKKCSYGSKLKQKKKKKKTKGLTKMKL